MISDEWRFRAKVVSGYDGDTFKAVLRLGMRQVCGEDKDPVPVRFDRIDTPELDSKSPATRAKAVAAKELVHERLQIGDPNARYLLLFPRKATKVVFDKYGRLLCVVYYQRVTSEKVGRKVVEHVEWVNLNQELLDSGLARPYKGGRREAWE